jgi:polyribonucleotide nucleotidyltransferase
MTPTCSALVAASAALNASKIPFADPSPRRVGRVQGKWVLNPTFQQLAYSDMEIVVAGSQDSINMVEGGALEVSEEDDRRGAHDRQKGIAS